MPRRWSLVVAFVLAACALPEPVAPPSEAALPSVGALADMMAEVVGVLNRDSCMVGPAAIEICDASFVITCSGGLHECAATCRRRIRGAS